MPATAVTGVGLGSADGLNKGSEYNTLGIGHIVDLPRYGVLYTEFPPDGNWNFIGNSGSSTDPTIGTLNTFYLGFRYGPLYQWSLGYVQSSTLYHEEVIAVNDPDGAIAIDPDTGLPEVTFLDTTSAGIFPFTFRTLYVTFNPIQNPPNLNATINWRWNDSFFFCKVTLFPPF